MNLKQLINKSVYGTIGYISSQDDLDLLEQYILYNLPVLKEFKNIVVATNYGFSLQNENTQLWKKYFSNCIILDSNINRGHNFGTADLDNLIFDWCKENNKEWLCKSANDVIIQESILDKQIDEADFYYLNGIGYGGMVPYNFDFDKIVNEDFYPQTNFYFINVSKIDYLNDQMYLDKTYEYTQNIPNYNGKIWEYVKGWSCEDFLKQCVERNNLPKYHLISDKKYLSLLQLVKNNQIHDCSHKNIMIEGICHYQYNNQQIIEI
tara:strand:+ start:118 stop:909 length:792 start_codon:yes stop_codon:yes gene_type:complete